MNDVKIETTDGQAKAAAVQIEDEGEDTDFESKSFFSVGVKNYQKMSLWFIVSTALCAFRAALPISVAVAYI